MKKSFKNAIIVLLALILVGTMCISLAACNNGKVVETDFNDEYYTTDYYFGTADQGEDGTPKINLEEFTKTEDATFSISATEAATLEDDELKIRAAGEFVLTITKSDGTELNRNVHVLEGAVNAYTAEEAYAGVEASKEVCLMSDIETGKLADGKNEYFWLKNNFYGNTFLVDASETVVNDGTRVFGIYDADGITLRDVHISSYDIKEGEDFDLTVLVDNGNTVVVENSTNIKMLNCFIENAHKLVRLSNAQIYVEGCYFRTSSDASFAIGASSQGPSDVTMKNNVFMNSFVCPILFFCTEKNLDPANYCKLHIQGFLDLYAWVDSKNVKIIPSTEIYSSMNTVIANYANKASYDSYFYKENGLKYLHLGMFVICSGSGSENHPTIDYEGTDIAIDKSEKAKTNNKLGFVRRDFPMPDVAKKILTTTEVIGYSYGDFPEHLGIGKTVNDNPAIWDELHTGRK